MRGRGLEAPGPLWALCVQLTFHDRTGERRTCRIGARECLNQNVSSCSLQTSTSYMPSETPGRFGSQCGRSSSDLPRLQNRVDSGMICMR